METNFYCCTRTGRTIAKKTMEDGNDSHTKNDKTGSANLSNLHSEFPAKYTTNGHDLAGEPYSSPDERHERHRLSSDTCQEENIRNRINPLRIQLGKRPFIDNSVQNQPGKKRKLYVNKPTDTTPLLRNPVSRVPKLIPKFIEKGQFHNVTSHNENSTNEQDKPVPRLVPKSQALQFNKQYKKGKLEKSSQLKEYAQSLGLQPMVKFKCRKCCSMTFKTLAMLKEHQLVCRAQVKEPALNSELVSHSDTNSSGPSRVTRKVYLCSACGTYYENWNLFLHMREVHNRHICLFCLGMFSKADKLSTHLINKHNVQEFNYNSKEEFFNTYNGTLYLMCCVCDEICSEKDDFFNHDCNNVKPKPVPVLVAKNSVKSNNFKQTKNCKMLSNNGPSNLEKNIHDNIKLKEKEISEEQMETFVNPMNKHEGDTNETELANVESSFSSENSVTTNKDTSSALDTTDSVSDLEKSLVKPSSPNHNVINNNKKVLNGEENLEHANGKYFPQLDTDMTKLSVLEPPPKSLNTTESSPKIAPAKIKSLCPSTDKEKEVGIKLKLSLNSANSPVIINSTVDPNVGKNVHKPPSRARRPPKRYEKMSSVGSTSTPKQPSIKMTICDKADTPFVKSTVYENNQETVSKIIINNNLDTKPTTPEHKVENPIKTTIYDNKQEDVNTLNRVPKLTVRVPKELLDKDSSSDYSSDSDTCNKLTVDENCDPDQEQRDDDHLSLQPETDIEMPLEGFEKESIFKNGSEIKDENVDIETLTKTEITEPTLTGPKMEESVAVDETPVIELSLDKPLDKYPLKDLLKVFLSSTIFNCIYCNHVRKIAVNCEQLALHMMAQHRFKATVDSITAEELLPETIITKVKTEAEDLHSVFINLDSYDSVEKLAEIQFDHSFECFQCYFKTAVHKDLYLHNRKMHQKTILLCVMCKSNFYSYSELLCHLCPGTYDPEYEIKFRCCLCNVNSIPSSFRLMVHLRKIHHTCDVCLEFCHNQMRLSNHVWKHKLHHLCYRCGIAYRNKPDITNHLFWKHGTESVMCKKCLQKKWPHVYHFCAPPSSFTCDECNLQFTKAVCLKVHKRFHSNDFPHVCTELDCTEKFVSKNLLKKHLEEHRKKLFIEDFNEVKPTSVEAPLLEMSKDIPSFDLAKDAKEPESAEVKAEVGIEQLPKKTKKKKLKDKDALLLEVNLPALNLSESDSDESDGGMAKNDVKTVIKDENSLENQMNLQTQPNLNDTNVETLKSSDESKKETEDEKPIEQQVLDIWDNFKKYQDQKQKQKTPPLVPIRKHVCESDHDYCLVPTDINGEEDMFNMDKKKSKKSPKKKHGGLSSSSSSSSDSDSSCSCRSNCSCSSSSGSSSSSSSDSDSSEESGNEKKKSKYSKKSIPPRRLSNGSNVDVLGMSETPVLIPEKPEPQIAESDLETDESETDEEFYDEHPQQLANKFHAEKKNQLLLLATVAPSDGGSMSGEASRPSTPIKDESKSQFENKKVPSTKKKSKKKKKSRSSKKCAPIKLNIPKDIISKSDLETSQTVLAPNKITISLQSNTIQIPEASQPPSVVPAQKNILSKITENKRASKRRRVPNKFYGYSSDEEPSQAMTALKPQQPPKLEWRKEDLPSPVTHKTKKEVPSTTIPQRLYNYSEPFRLTTPIPDPEPPKILMNTESMESSDSDSSDGGGLQICNPKSSQTAVPVPPPSYLNSGTSSLPYPFQRPAVREAKEGESVYCYCRCPYDEVSEMIGCDAEGCPIEWFHFECVGIMVPPKGKWYCPECRKNQSFSGYR